MSVDDQREARIRALVDTAGPVETATTELYQRTYLDLCFLLRRLDEARSLAVHRGTSRYRRKPT